MSQALRQQMDIFFFCIDQSCWQRTLEINRKHGHGAPETPSCRQHHLPLGLGTRSNLQMAK